MFLRVSSLFCSADILSRRLTSEGVLFIRLSTQPLLRNLCLNRVIFSSNVVFEDFLLRSLHASPLIEPVLESFCRFEVCVHFKNRFFFFFIFRI